ncbi:MAG: bifunctional oligoribonuclease/PAP phosphatase NrnA [Eubacteriales bacterium]|nr:bifunctional oligoribonuclease/PAP phosphatase NrnA [Eubacteriales bacterium]
MKIDVTKCAELLKEHDNILILTHAHPDGDTLGSGFALCRALMEIGKICAVINADEIPKKYSYLFDDIVPIKFKPDYVVAVDVATINLLGELESEYPHIDLCIDHHSTNTEYADNLLLEDVPANCQIMYDVINALGVEINAGIANCLYTGLTTDTGCFRYDSTTAQTYRVAAELIEKGAENGRINRIMFETKTKTYARLERLALESMRFYDNERVAVITITQEMYRLTGSNEQETEAIAPLTRQIEGVEVGITIREKADGTCKASLRTHNMINAAELAKCFGGGGHAQAAACRFDCDVKEARRQLVEKCGELLNDGNNLHQ